MKLEEPYNATKHAYSFDLSEDMLSLLGEEFRVDRVIAELSEQIKGESEEKVESIACEILRKFGRDLAKRSLELGEEYSDRTWEVLKIADEEAAGSLRFPLFPQRFLEIAYLSTHPHISSLNILENNHRQLVFRIDSCALFNGLREKIGGETVRLIPCKRAWLTLCEELFRHFGFDVVVENEACISQDNHCQFNIRKI